MLNHLSLFQSSLTEKSDGFEIKGEVYFEVSKYISKNGQLLPFIVSANNKTRITVLGTHFNINAYNDESAIKTTLLEGSVKVSSLINQNSKVIKPGSTRPLLTNREK